jgi:hypothetical protein
MEHWEEKELRAKAIAKKRQGKQKHDMFSERPQVNKKHRIAELRRMELDNYN